MTLFQPVEETEAALPNALLHPVTLSEESAAASLKIHLANLLTKKRDTFPKLREITIESLETTLVFIPFTSHRLRTGPPAARNWSSEANPFFMRRALNIRLRII